MSTIITPVSQTTKNPIFKNIIYKNVHTAPENLFNVQSELAQFLIDINIVS